MNPFGDLGDLFDNDRRDNNRRRRPPMPPPNRRPMRRDDDGIADELIGGLGVALGSALGSAISQAVKPAMNTIGNSVANSIKQNANAATQSMVSIAESQKQIANKKETISYEYFDECPYCGAPREGNSKECEYCGSSMVKNEQTKIE